jgi:hypothetical protein
LGEHREIHAIHTIVSRQKKGYSRHPETLRWRNHLPALWLRHQQVVAEMRVRGFKHFSPLPALLAEVIWPSVFIDAPSRQFELLAGKYTTKEQGRIPLPANAEELLGSHALSLISRECLPAEANPATSGSFASLAEALVHRLRQQPTEKGRAEMLALLEVPNLCEANLPLDYIPPTARQATVLNELLLWP